MGKRKAKKKESQWKKGKGAKIGGRWVKGSRKFNGQTYHASTQHDSKRAAQKRADEIRDYGGQGRRLNARIIKHGKKYVVYAGGFSKGPHGWGYRKGKTRR